MKMYPTRLSGIPASPGVAIGKAHVLNSGTDFDGAGEDAILISKHATVSLVPVLRRARAVICSTGGRACHLAIVARELGKPCVTALGDRLAAIRTGIPLTVDGSEGLVIAHEGHSLGGLEEPAIPVRSNEPYVPVLQFGVFSQSFRLIKSSFNLEVAIGIAAMVSLPECMSIGPQFPFKISTTALSISRESLFKAVNHLNQLLALNRLTSSVWLFNYYSMCEDNSIMSLASGQSQEGIKEAARRYFGASQITWAASLVREKLIGDFREFFHQASHHSDANDLESLFLESLNLAGHSWLLKADGVQSRPLTSTARDSRIPAMNPSFSRARVLERIRSQMDRESYERALSFLATIANIVELLEQKNLLLRKVSSILFGSLPQEAIAASIGLSQTDICDRESLERILPDLIRHLQLNPPEGPIKVLRITREAGNTMDKPVQMVVIENIGTCNLRCRYCFPEHMWNREGRSKTMGKDVYTGILERAFPMISSSELNVRFAGGEPLIVGIEWLDWAFRQAKEIAGRFGKKVTFSLQTNATLIDMEVARFLAENHVEVGVSIDGDTQINEEVRGSTERVLEGLKLLQQAMGRSPGVIVTVTRCNARRMKQVVDYLDDLEIVYFRANLVGATISSNSHLEPSAEDWFEAKKDIFEAVLDKDGRLMEYNLSEAVRKLVDTAVHGSDPFSKRHGCAAMRCPAGRGLLYFDQRGNAYPCPRANVTPEARLGNFSEEAFAAQWDNTIRQLDADMSPPQDCLRCPARIVCDYGCHPFNNSNRSFFEVNCDATKDFYTWLTKRLGDVAKIYVLMKWRTELKSNDDYAALKTGFEPSPALISALTGQLTAALHAWRARHCDESILEKRFSKNPDREGLMDI